MQRIWQENLSGKQLLKSVLQEKEFTEKSIFLSLSDEGSQLKGSLQSISGQL